MSGMKGLKRTYSVLFAAAAILVYIPFLYYRKSFVWDGDGLYQHFNAFVFLGKYLRDILRSLFHGQLPHLTMYSFSFGFGGDILTTLSYYVIGDPFSLLSVFFPAKYAEFGYGLLALLRVYAAGLSFCLYARRMKCGRTGILCGAIAYCFCGYALEAAVRHPFFTCPMIWLPLMWLGIEKILGGERPFFYILAVFFAAVSNFYFFYMLVIMTILYVLVRGGEHVGFRLPALFKLGLRILAFSIPGVLLSAVIFLPTVMAFLGCSRSGGSYAVPLLYSFREYASLPASLLTNARSGEWSYIGFAPVVLLAVLNEYMHRTKEKWPKLLLLLFFIFLLFPFFGYALNGFSYAANRWIFAGSLLGCFILARNAEDLLQLPAGRKIALTAICAVYALVVIRFSPSWKKNALVSLAVLALTLIGLLAADKCRAALSGRQTGGSRQIIGKAFLLCSVVLGVAVNGFFKYTTVESGYITEFHDAGTALAGLEGDDAYAASLIGGESSFYRINTAYSGLCNDNFPLYRDDRTTTLYWSMIPGRISDFMEHNQAYALMPDRYAGMESRTMLLPLASAEYYLAGEGYTYQVPYSYLKADTLGGRVLYRTDWTLPLGCTCDSYITEEEFLALTPAQRQQAMLQTAVADPQDPALLGTIAHASLPLRFTDLDIPYSIAAGEGAEVEDGRITVREPYATVTLQGDFTERSELYAYFKGLHYESAPRGRMQAPVTDTYITASAGNGNSSSLAVYTPQSTYAHGREDYLLNMYYFEGPRDTVTIFFSQPGTYTYDSLQLIAQPVDGFEEYIRALREEQLENIEIAADRVRGSITLTQDKILCLSIPYSEGWTLTVDGQKTGTFPVNDMYTGAVLTEGTHVIELQYTTPYLRAGLFISLLTAAGLLLAAVCSSIRGRRRDKQYPGTGRRTPE